MRPSEVRMALCGRSERVRMRGMGTGSTMMGVSSSGGVMSSGGSSSWVMEEEEILLLKGSFFLGVRKASLESEESTGLVGDFDFVCFCKNLGSFEDKLGLVDGIDGLGWSRRLLDMGLGRWGKCGWCLFGCAFLILAVLSMASFIPMQSESTANI
jgi:hypothetical protein